MSFIRQQIKQIRTGGLRALWRKICFFPQWFSASRYGQTLASDGYRLAVAVKPNSAGAYYRLGKALSQLNRLDEAISSLRKAVSLRSDFAEAHAQMAKTLIKLGRFDEAFAAWEQVFQLKPDWPEVYDRIQNAFYFCGQTWAARSIMQRVLDARNDFARKSQLDKLGIRFLRDFPTAIGHIALLDSYVKMGILGQRSPARPILLVHPRLANPCYLDYWRRYLPDMVTDPAAVELLSPFAKYLEDHIFVVKDSSGNQRMGGKDYGGVGLQMSIQAQWEAEGRGPLLTLTDSDNDRGWQCLQTLGVPPDAWFVGLHVREGRTTQRGARDADIRTYRMAIESIVARGGWVIRMGDPSMTPMLPIPHAIDYVHSAVYSDWMDVFLWAKCRFFIATTSGPAFVPPTFGVPCVATNWFPLLFRRWFGQDIYIPKLLWSESEERFLTFAEALSSGVGNAESLDFLSSVGIRVIDNTPEEIDEAVVEILERLDGTLRYSDEDEQLQARFNTMWASNAFLANGRIGRAFLRKYAHLI
jgi:putative glycosyltransferase (TIGR04372 family)